MKVQKMLKSLMAAIGVALLMTGSVFAATTVTTEAELKAAVAAGGEITLGADIAVTEMIAIPADKTVTLDLNGKAITVPAATDRHIYALNNKGVLTIMDSVGTGSISSRGIYNGYDGVSTENTVAGSKLTVEGGTFYAIDTNGGASIFNCAEVVINGGVFDGQVAAFNGRKQAKSTINGGTFRSVSNYAIQQNGGGELTIINATVDRGFGAVGCFGGKTTIKGGTFLPTGIVGKTCHVVYVAAGATVDIQDGTFKMNYPADAVPDSGSAVTSYYNGTLAISGGSFTAHFDNKSPVELSAGSEISGGKFMNHAGEASTHDYVTKYIKEGYELNEDGSVVVDIFTYAEFNAALRAANGVYDGKGITVTLKDSERSYRNNKTAQFFVGATNVNITDPIETVKVSNVNFVFEDDATDDDCTSGELQVFAKYIEFTGCTFNGVAVSPWGRSNSENAETATFTNCMWKDLSGRYGIHQNRASNLTVTNCKFENCERGIHTNSSTPATIIITNNTFTGIGDGYGVLCLAENGDLSDATLNISGNVAEGQVMLRQLSPTVTYEQVSAILDTAKNTYGTAYVTGSTEPKPPVAKIGDTPYTTLEAALNAAKAGDTVEIVVAGNYELKNNYVEEGAYRLPDNFTLKGIVDGVVVTNGPTIRANNLTIDNVDFNNPVQKNYQSGLVFYLTGDSVIKNSDIYGYWGASYYSVVTGTLLVDNCTFDTQVYGLHIAEGNADVTVKNSVIAGWNTYGSDIRVTFTGCTFKDNRGYHYLGFYGDAVIEDCKFEENVTIGGQTTDAIVIDISNSKVVDDNGDEIAEKSIYDIIEQETLDSDVVVKIDNIHVNGKVAKIGETTYATLVDALAAAQTGDTVTFLCDVEQEDGVVITDKKVKIDLNGKTFTVSNGASTNNRNLKINGASEVVISNGTMVAAGDYSSGAYGTVRTEDTAKVELQDLKLYNYRGNGLNVKACTGTSVTMTDVEIYAQYGGGVEAAGGTVELTDVVVQQKGMYTAPYNSMAISVNGGGTVTVQSGTYSTECITAEEANNQGSSHGPWVAGVLNSGGTLIINGGTFSNDNFGENDLAVHARGAILADTGAIIKIKGGTFNALKGIVDVQNNLGDASKNPTGEIKGGTFSADPTNDYIKLAEGYQSVKQPGKSLWQVGKLPNAEVVNMGPTTVTSADFGSGYWEFDLMTNAKEPNQTEPFDLQVVLNFIAKDSPEQAAESAYADYFTDFRIKIEGMSSGSITADEDCYLAGYYAGMWVKVALTGFEIKDGVGYPVISPLFPFTYEMICSNVKDFICGIHLSEKVLNENPNLKVSLDLGMTETVEEMIEGGNFIQVGETYDYTADEMRGPVAISGPDYFTTVTGAVAAALETGNFVKLVKDASLQDDLELGKKFVLNLGGNALSANGKTLAIADSVVTITNGVLSGFTAANVTLAGNAILTVTDKNVADSFRTSDAHYVSQNANGTYSIMLKSAFRVFITVVDGEPRIGFFKDCDTERAPTAYAIKGATNLETPEWADVACEETADASAASELPLHWVKPATGCGFRFFKLLAE